MCVINYIIIKKKAGLVRTEVSRRTKGYIFSMNTAWPIDPLVLKSFKLEVSEKLLQG